MDSWNVLVAEQTARRPVNHLKTIVSGGGLPIDPELWPVLERLWALGIPTAGSCVGHSNTGYTYAFVSISGLSDPKTEWYARCRRVLEAHLAPINPAVGRFSVSPNILRVQYAPPSTDPKHFAAYRAEALAQWCNRLDVAGQHCLADGQIWTPWDVLPRDVPDLPTVAQALAASPWRFVRFLNQQPPDVQRMIRIRMLEISIAWETLPGIRTSSTAVWQARWDAFWHEVSTWPTGSDEACQMPMAK